MNVCLLSPLD